MRRAQAPRLPAVVTPSRPRPGANAGARTDAVGDYQAQFDADGKRGVFRPGTGGSSGASFLRQALDLTFFPELLTSRTEAPKE